MASFLVELGKIALHDPAQRNETRRWRPNCRVSCSLLGLVEEAKTAPMRRRNKTVYSVPHRANGANDLMARHERQFRMLVIGPLGLHNAMRWCG